MFNKLLFVLLTIIFSYYITKYRIKDYDSPVVNTSSGKVKGVIKSSRDGRQFYAYHGIPYAQAPVGDLRFESPRPITRKWRGIKDAGNFGEPCIQLSILTGSLTGSEDCLFVNVFTPKFGDESLSSQSLPVMVYIHGGSFYRGASEQYRPNYLMDEDVVVVTMNYRLGVLGFLNTGDEVARGNQGLKDQSLALKWVQKNIHRFGGDPQRVTLFGESAGGASVHFHMLSPMSKGLFHRTITQSGVATSHWAIWKDPKGQAERLGAKLGCGFDESIELVKCLKSLDAQIIVETQRTLALPTENPIDMFAPTVEKVRDSEAFIADLPVDLIREGRMNKVSWMTGVNSAEGLLLSTPIAKNESRLSEVEKRFDYLFPIYLEFGEELSQRIRKFYFGQQKIDSIDQLDSFTDIFSDRWFFWPNEEAVILHAKHHPVHLYYFTYKGESSLANLLMSIRGKFPPLFELYLNYITTWINRKVFGVEPPHYGVCHLDEIFQLFLTPFVDSVYPGSKDYEMSKEMVRVWVDFAYGRELIFNGVNWPPVNEKSPIKYFNIDSTPSLIKSPIEERMEFWRSLNISLQTQTLSDDT